MNCFTFPSRKAIVIQRNAYDLLGSCVVFFSISPTKHEIMVWTKAISTSPQRLLKPHRVLFKTASSWINPKQHSYPLAFPLRIFIYSYFYD
jgi:hypothetical protein